MTATQWAAAGADTLDRENPWPGLASYEESSHDFFSGRSSEADDLLRRIVSDPVTVLFGKSGLGKTSLLKAGVFPRLREKGLLPILLRLQVQADAAPFIEQVRLAMFDELRSANIEHATAGTGETLWEYLHRARQEFWTSQNRLVRPVLVFDQFEEIFTLGGAMPAAVDRLREDLADLAENRIPAALADRLCERAPVEVGLDVQARPYKMVIALREDFLADLEEWRLSMPSLRRNRMRLLPMRRDQALEAVFNQRTSHLVSEPIARGIVAFLSSGAGSDDGASDHSGDSVEPALLSLFCRGVNEHRQRDGKSSFDEALVEGGKGTIVADFYRASVADQPERVRRFIEDELITEHGFRNSYAIESAIARGSISDRELTTLINRHLLRHEHHLGTDRVELTHDLLTKAVADGRDERRTAERLQRERRQRWKMLGFAAACLIVAIGFGAMALAASRARDAARSRELAAHAASTMNHDPELAIALALEGLKRYDTVEARSALINAAQYAWPSVALDGKEHLGGDPVAVALSSDGNELAVLASGGAIKLWNVGEGEPRLMWSRAVPDATTLTVSPDKTLVAVARSAAVDLLDATTGTVRSALPADLEQNRDKVLVAFSPDNVSLAASLSQQRMQVWDRHEDTWAAVPPPPVPPGLTGFALRAGGRRIVAVAQPPSGLSAYAIDRKADGSWAAPVNLDLSVCMKPQSVSQGAVYFSATWKPRACTYEVSSNQSDPDIKDLVISDIVWSVQGYGFAELLPQERSLDLIVGRQRNGERQTSHIKGAHPNEATSEKSHIISVSDDGTRVAVIDSDDDHLVRIYSLAHHKPLLSRLPTDSFVVAPDGSWIAVSTPGLDGNSTTVDVISFVQAFTPNQPSKASTRIVLDRPPDRLLAARNSVVAVWREPEATRVFEAATGKLRFERPGSADPLGRGGEWLLTRVGGAAWQVIQTSDGSPVAVPQLDQRNALPKVSSAGGAFALIHANGSRRFEASLYAVRDRTITFAGRIPDVGPRATILEVADDGRSIAEGTTGHVWRVTDPAAAAHGGATPTTTESPDRAPGDATVVSPMRGYEIRLDQNQEPGGVRVLRRSDSKVVRDFTLRSPAYRFSADDRWLAVWAREEHSLEVVDLPGAEILFHFDPTLAIDSVAFLTGDLLRVQFAPVTTQFRNEATLIPLQPSMMMRFAAWLSQRSLTEQDRCLYGLGGDECRVKSAAPRKPAEPDAKNMRVAPRAQ